jgi:2-hydroxy-3-keto-5-methylthiopentenyl-1-phosphate phosphatase
MALRSILMDHGISSSETSRVCHFVCVDVDFGHDKSRAIKPYAALPTDGRPILVYCGDGVSDISAARETDLLFAKKGRDLVLHCLKENVPFYPFDVMSLWNN